MQNCEHIVMSQTCDQTRTCYIILFANWFPCDFIIVVIQEAHVAPGFRSRSFPMLDNFRKLVK